VLLLTGSYGFGAALVIAAASACETQSRACMRVAVQKTRRMPSRPERLRGAIINAETPRRPNTFRRWRGLHSNAHCTRVAKDEEATRAADIYTYIHVYDTESPSYTRIRLGVSLSISLLSFFDSLLPASRVDEPALDSSNNHECNGGTLRTRS
jgi:hypothetical protein